MRCSLALAVVLALAALGGQAQTTLQSEFTYPGHVRRLTLAETVQLAEDADVALLSRRAELLAAEGARAEAASPLFNNPQISVDRARYNVPQTSLPYEQWYQWHAGISQTLEIAGQQQHRRGAADATLQARRAEIEDLRRRVRSESSAQFYRLLAQQERLRFDEQALQLFESTAAAVQKLKATGEDTRLDANVASVEAERAKNQVALAREQLAETQADLATRLQLPVGVGIEVEGQLEATPPPWTRQELLATAASSPRLQALAAREDAAIARLKLERASVYPDVTVGITAGREGATEARERLTMLSVSVPVPLFKRNDAGIGQALTELEQARVERQAGIREAQAQVVVMWEKFQSVASRVERLRGSVMQALQENEALSVKSQKAGQISVLDLIVVNRQALDARRDLIDAELDLQLTRFALESASGWSAERTAP